MKRAGRGVGGLIMSENRRGAGEEGARAGAAQERERGVLELREV